MKIQKNKNLKKYNFFKTDVVADFFIEIKEKKDLEEFFTDFYPKKIKKFFVLGEGSNIIFKNKFFRGAVLKISNNFVDFKAEKKAEAGAGKNWDIFLKECQEKKIYQIQNLSSIPGSVGAAAFGNIGAFGSEVKNFIFGVWAFDIKKKEFVFFENSKCDFWYRNSFFKKNKERFIIYSVIFDFSKKFQKEIEKIHPKKDYFDLKHFQKKHNIKNLKTKNLREEIQKIRKEIYPDVKKFPNVGSTFANTEISKNQLSKIQKKFPEIPFWDQGKKIKIPTAFLFDKILNLNGKIFGKIKVDKKRPLFFVNMGGATGKDFFNLCQKIKKNIYKKEKIKIKEEVYFVE